MSDPITIARWMLDEIHDAAPRRVYQQRLVHKMRTKFGDHWSYTNKNGNQAFDRRVLKEFGAMKSDNVYWDRADQSWRVIDDDLLARFQERDAIRKERAAERKRRLGGS